MMRILLLVLFAGLSAPERAAAQRIVASPPVVVAEEPDGFASWTHLAAHPTDPGRVMICGAVIRPRGSSPGSFGFVDVSRDGGATWRRTLVDSAASWNSEQSGAFGRLDRAYFTTTRDHAKGGLALFRSEDGGLTWRATVEGGTFVDLTAMAVDTSEDSLHRDRLYVLGSFLKDPATEPLPARKGRVPMPLLRSEDGGLSFAPPAFPRRDPQLQRAVSFPGGGVVLGDGTVVGVYQSMHVPRGAEDTPPVGRPKFVEAIRSTDGGLTVSASPVARYEYWRDDGSLPDLPSIAADPLRRGGVQAVFAAWSDLSTGRSVVRLATSWDGGAKWSDPVRVDDLASTTGTFSASHPSVAVNRDGVVAVSWRDMRRACWRASASLDGGRTFGASSPLGGDRPSHSASPREGDYSIVRGSDVGLAADAAGRFHTAWAESRGTGSRLLAIRFEVHRGDRPGKGRD